MDSISPIRHQHAWGFTLMELIIVLLLISILLAYPLLGIQHQLNQTHQLDGQMALLDLANRMERYHAKHHTYQHASIATGRSSDILDTSTSPEGWYTLHILQANDSTYLLQARLTTKHIQTDAQCSTLHLNHDGEIYLTK